MPTYGQYCPIARGAEIFAIRWTPIIVRNLLLGCETFGEIHAGAPGMPRSLLTKRLAMLEHHGLIERSPNPRGRGSRYRLTPMGFELGKVCDALGEWGARWLETSPEQQAPYAVLWALCSALGNRELPADRIVVRFDIPECEERRFWLVVGQPKPELCIKYPGYEENLIVATNPATLVKWHTGQVNLGQAIHARTMKVTGHRDLIRTLAQWGGLSRFAPIPPMRNGNPPSSRRAPPATPLPPWPAAAIQHQRPARSREHGTNASPQPPTQPAIRPISLSPAPAPTRARTGTSKGGRSHRTAGTNAGARAFETPGFARNPQI